MRHAALVLSDGRVAGRVRTGFTGSGRLSEPGELLRQWVRLGARTPPTGSAPGRRLLYRLGDVALLPWSGGGRGCCPSCSTASPAPPPRSAPSPPPPWA
ncbi:hypothetical protein ABTY20_22780 [Streptomyces sp. NPDC126497]|uniref:hypothetical protein n=1 Tax=Streptomyces sp. NPDC126497 TaxID=3155313 RepID=UPI00333244B3